jgi:hypothetical protein
MGSPAIGSQSVLLLLFEPRDVVIMQKRCQRGLRLFEVRALGHGFSDGDHA